MRALTAIVIFSLLATSTSAAVPIPRDQASAPPVGKIADNRDSKRDQNRPRPCWYEPGPDAATMLRRQMEVKEYYHHVVPGGDWEEHIRQFREKVGVKGRWWTPAYNAEHPDGLACWSSLDGALWVPEGAPRP
ncbi:hypothetical protein DQ384_38565 [Sphaerisporangium album]|uniref:Secreted protein n=1 Tax=Sphaerisporangium album TaxID=509200 RepID=A0A367ELQ5_9ACTN|nr:hypothetical protein [Sphaerisporangium album]RCG19038.1 hypothetical protein DQ384_38565 [Sphaerisporangium album]